LGSKVAGFDNIYLFLPIVFQVTSIIKALNTNKLFDFTRENRYAVLFAAILVVYFFNMFVDVMEIDAAQYALISMEMSFTKSFLHIYQQGQDYLDKPPLLFWLSSLSFIVFGLSNFAYKLPSVILAIVGIYSLYRFALIWYSKEKAVLSALILASSQALFLITNDVRTDTNLLGLVMFSIWQMNVYLIKGKWKHLIFASIGFGFAMMAKGPIALIIPAAAFGTEFLLKRQWENILKPQWILMLIIIAITLIPMSYGLYTQFDLHPEKFVYGLQGPSGLRFFFWTQSFGRITGENYWENDSGYFYFLHTILWDFQPWVLLFVPALIIKIWNIFKSKFRADVNEEYISIGGFVFVFIALSMSRYKLPHYIFVLFPFASVITADFILKLRQTIHSRVSKVQFGLMQVFWLLLVINFIFFFPPKNAWLPVILAILFLIHIYSFKSLKGNIERIFIPTIITAVSFNLMMALHFYPILLKYQASSQIGKYIYENKIPEDRFYIYNNSSYSLDFYSKRINPSVDSASIKNISPKSLVYADETTIQEINRNQIPYKLVKEYPAFKVTALELPFLYAKTREKTLKTHYLIEIQ
jgi:4-amino-4-deoxy-L-arabinose transferase-like glycosyltransferase